MDDFSDLKGKRVLVTGGSKGIGRHAAAAFASCGAHVVITGRNEGELLAACEELRAIEPKCGFIRADMRVVAEVGSMVDEAVSRLGGLDVVVNNAGINIAKPALEVTEEDWDAVLDTNLKGMFFCSQRAARHMIPQKKGRIINVLSQMAFVGYYDRAAYCSSKGGGVQLTKALAVEWASSGIRVNAVAPTFTETEMTAGMLRNGNFAEDVKSRILLGELARPEDTTGAILFLASEMANFITGETIRVDGGWTAI